MHPLKSIFALLFVMGTFLVAAQPQKVNYQAVALTAGGQTVKNQAIKLRLSILDSSATGTVLYTETHQPTTDGSGQFSVFLGGGTVTLGAFSNILWNNGKDKFLKAEADVTGGTNYVLMGTSQIVSVPYAISAGSLTDSAKVISQDGTQWSLIVGPNGPTWQQSSGPGGLNMNYPCPGVPTVTYSGQTYNTVQIGTQCWLKENLNVGAMVQGSSNQTNNGIIEKYCYNNLPANCDTFGGLYQWAEAVQYQNGASNSASPNPAFVGNIQGICPTGWHIPSKNEITFLVFFLGDTMMAGEQLKVKFGEWGIPNNATDISGFSMQACGHKALGSFKAKENSGFWTSTNQSFNACGIFFNRTSILSFSNTYFKDSSLSIRCLKD